MFSTLSAQPGADRPHHLGLRATSTSTIQAVFRTLLDANDNLYLACAFYGRRVYAKVTTRSGIVTSLGAIAVTVTLPMVLNAAAICRKAGRRRSRGFAIPLAIIGMSRFLALPREKEIHLTAERRRSPGEGARHPGRPQGQHLDLRHRGAAALRVGHQRRRRRQLPLPLRGPAILALEPIVLGAGILILPSTSSSCP